MNRENLISGLKSLQENPTDEFALEFETTLEELMKLRDPKVIQELTEVFEDDAEYDELMFSMIHLIETFDDKVYVSQLLASSPAFTTRTPRWASIVFMRVLNSEPTKLELVRQLRCASSDSKRAVKDLMEKINARSAQFIPKTVPVIVAASE